MKKTIGAQKCRQLQQLLSGLRPLSVSLHRLRFPTEIRSYLNTHLDEDTTVTGVMIQVSEVKKWLEHAIEGNSFGKFSIFYRTKENETLPKRTT